MHLKFVISLLSYAIFWAAIVFSFASVCRRLILVTVAFTRGLINNNFPLTAYIFSYALTIAIYSAIVSYSILQYYLEFI